MTMLNSVCECCNEHKPIVGVYSIPGVPMSIAWCQECINAGAVPYWVAVGQTALCGGLDEVNDAWREVIMLTLVHFKKTKEQFFADVKEEESRMLKACQDERAT